MIVLIAPDAFKDCLSARQVADALCRGMMRFSPEIIFDIAPMADGGEGTARAMIRAANGQWIRQRVMGPLPDMQVEAGFAWFGDDKTALVEMASASGLELLSEEQMNPLKTTTYGTGQLIKAALEYGACKILLAVGGSATVDGGLGAATALGWQFLDEEGNPIPLGGAGLEKITKIVKPKKFSIPPVEVLCDVDNPLCGEYGAAKVYGPQKGATPEMAERLEKGLLYLAAIVRKQLHRDINNVAGAGAAGGLTAGAVAFMEATVVSGIETLISRSKLWVELQSADWIITGEGCFDEQSLRGKVVSGIAKMACESRTRLAVVAGQVAVSPDEYQKLGITTAIACRKDDMSLDYALKNCRTLLHCAAQQFAKEHLS